MSNSKSLACVIFACIISSAGLAGADAKLQDNPARFSFAGRVVDEQGKPIPDVKVIATYSVFGAHATGYIDSTTSDAEGYFTIDRQTALSGESASAVVNDVIRLAFTHPDFQRGDLSDLHLFSHDAVTHLNIVLRSGRLVEGKVIDAAGAPVTGALVEITFVNAPDQRRATVSDGNGHFRINGLPNAGGTINVLTTNTDKPAMTGQQIVAANETELGAIPLAEIQLPPQAVVHELFGMKLVDVDPAIQKSFHLQRSDGVMILDPGTHSDELKIGQLQRGDQFWMVGGKQIKNIAEFEKTLLDLRQSLSSIAGVRVVYCCSRADLSGTNTQYMQISKAQLDELSQAVK